MQAASMDSSRQHAARALEDLDLSTEELGRFEKAMKDPKFVDMLSEYAKEMEDPKLREENEKYLRQLEREGQGAAVYGNETELVAPNAGFCVKTKNKLTGAKAFINICHSDKIGVAKSTVRTDGSGTEWSIPYSLSTARREKDKAGKDCEVHDFVIGSATYERCRTDRRFKTFVIETALDSVEGQRKCKLDRSFTLPKLRFKGPGDSPPVLAVKASGKQDEGAAPKDSPVSPLQPSKVMNRTASPFSFDRATKQVRPNVYHTPNPAGGQTPPADKSLLDLERAANPDQSSVDGETGKSPASEDCAPSGKVAEMISTSKGSGASETQPEFDIVEQGVMDLSTFWLDERTGPVQKSRPESLLLRVELPLLESAAALDLDVSEQRVVLRASGKYHLDVALPYPVEDSKGRAKFDKVRRRLEVVLPVARPPAPPRKPFQEPPPADCAEHESPEELAELSKTPPSATEADFGPSVQPEPLSVGSIEAPADYSDIPAKGMTNSAGGALPLTSADQTERCEKELDIAGPPSLSVASFSREGRTIEDEERVCSYHQTGKQVTSEIKEDVNSRFLNLEGGLQGKSPVAGKGDEVSAEANAQTSRPSAPELAQAISDAIVDSSQSIESAAKAQRVRHHPKLTCSLVYDID